MRKSSKAFQDVVRDMYVAYEWTLLQTVPCLAHSSRLDALSGWHGDDFYTEGEPETLDEVDAMILGTFKATCFHGWDQVRAPSAGRAGAIDSFGSDSVPARHKNRSVPRPRQV